jgi:trigger factor
MKFAVEEISPVKKSITVEIPEEVVAKELQTAYSDLNRRVRVPGFRPGKVPLSILEKRYSQSVHDDVIRRLVPDYCQRAIQEAHLSPVELPSIQDIQMKEKAPLTFKATVEIKPAFELGNYMGLKIPVPHTPLQESDVDRALEALRQQHAVLEALPPDHAAQEKDFVMIDFEGAVEGKPFEGGSGKGVMVQIGANGLIPGFEEQLINHKAGDRVEVHVDFPKDYTRKDLAGLPAVFQVTVREIKKQVVPDLDDEFAKDQGDFASLDQLREKVRENLTERLKKEDEHARRQALMKRLVETHPFDLPASMVDREVRAMLSQVQARLPKGTTLEQARIDADVVKKEIEPAARDKVKGWLILEAIADREAVEVTKEEVEDSLARMGEEMNIPVDDLKRLILSREGSLDGLARRLREDKAQDLVYAKTVFD